MAGNVCPAGKQRGIDRDGPGADPARRPCGKPGHHRHTTTRYCTSSGGTSCGNIGGNIGSGTGKTCRHANL